MLLLFLLSLFFGGEEPVIDQNPKVVYSIEQKREVDRYTSWVETLLAKSDFNKAISVARNAYANNPEITDLKSLYIKALSDAVSNLNKMLDFNAIQTLLNGVDESIAEHPQIVKMTKEVSYNIEQKNLHKLKYDELKVQFESAIKAANNKLKLGEFDEAANTIQSIPINVTKYEPKWTEVKQQLAGKIQSALKTKELELQKRRHERIEAANRINESFANCLNNYKRGESLLAYQSCKQALDSVSDKGSGKYKEIEIWTNLLSEDRQTKLKQLTAKAVDCYENNWIKCALHNWQKVLDVDPGNETIRKIRDAALDAQFKKAQSMLQEARAYSDLGRNDEAIATLKELQQIYPLGDSDIYIKASSLLSENLLNK